MRNSLTFGREKDVINGIGKGLEDSFKESKKLDKQIARTLVYHANPVKNIPLLNRLVSYAMQVKPLSSLEYSLRSGLNGSLNNLAKIGKKAKEESERVSQLEGICETAKEEEWSGKEFMEFIEINTDVDFVVELDGERYDFKTLVAEVDSLFPVKGEEGQEWYDWIDSHIKTSKDYLGSMELLCLVGSKWVGEMSRNYFDLTQLIGGMNQIHKTLNSLGNGAQASFSGQHAIGEYGKVYVKGMKELLKGYEKLRTVRETGSDDFKTAVEDLRNHLNNAKIEQDKLPKNGNYKLISKGN